MEIKKSPKQFLLLMSLSIVLSALFVFLGAPFLRLLKSNYGSKTYWTTGAAILILFLVLNPPLAIVLVSAWVVIGLYTELEERGRASYWTAFTAACIGTAIFFSGMWFIFTQVIPAEIVSELQKNITNLLAQVQGGGGSGDEQTLLNGVRVDLQFILSQTPSVLFILNLLTLSYGLMMEKKMAILFGIKYEKVASALRLFDFKNPDFFVWIAMFSFLGSILKLNNQMIALVCLNIFNVCVAVYFFQGLAVVETIMKIFRSGPVTRFLVYFIFVFQLFFVLSGVGFIDYWVDFRKRLKNIRTKEKKHNNGENI